MTTRRSFMFYAVMLGILTMMMPMGTDIFLASMPAFARGYGMPVSAAELTLAAFFAGNAAGQLELDAGLRAGALQFGAPGQGEQRKEDCGTGKE